MNNINKKTLSYAMVAVGAMPLLNLVLSNLIKSSMVSIVFTVLYFVIALGLACITGYLYFAQKSNDRFHLGLFIPTTIVTLGSLFQLRMVFLASKLQGDLDNYSKVIKQLKSVQGFSFLIVLALLISLGILVVGVCNLCFNKHLEETNHNIDVNIDADAMKQKTTNFVKSKNGKVLLGGILVVLIAFGAYKVWDTFFNKVELNLVDGLEIRSDGYNGQGTAYVDTNNRILDYDTFAGNEDILEFINDVSYEVVGGDKVNGELSNGDTVTIRAIYDEEEAKELKLSITDETTDTVENLLTKYKKAEDVNKDVLNKLEEYGLSELESDYNRYNDEKYTFTHLGDLLNIYTGNRDQKNTKEELIRVYKGVRSVKYFGDEEPKEETTYFIVEVSDFDSRYETMTHDELEDIYFYTRRVLGDELTDENIMDKVIENYKESYYTMERVQ